MREIEVRRHSHAVPGNPGQVRHLSQKGVTLARRVGETMGPFALVVTSELPRTFETALAMGFAVNAQDDAFNRFSGGDHVRDIAAEVALEASFGEFAEAVRRGGPTAQFAKQQLSALQKILDRLSEGDRALVVTHGAFIQPGAVGLLPDADHLSWGGPCRLCEGYLVTFENNDPIRIEIIRLPEDLARDAIRD